MMGAGGGAVGLVGLPCTVPDCFLLWHLMLSSPPLFPCPAFASHDAQGWDRAKDALVDRGIQHYYPTEEVEVGVTHCTSGRPRLLQP